jgi:hypothetical protein
MILDRERLEKATTEAGKSFWSKIAEEFPEITHSELDPGTLIVLQMQMEAAVERWYLDNYNRPKHTVRPDSAPLVIKVGFNRDGSPRK